MLGGWWKTFGQQDEIAGEVVNIIDDENFAACNFGCN